MADRGILHPDHAERLKDRAGQPYRPSNGTEGEIFEAAWCDQCRRDAAFRAHYAADGPASEQPDGCPILVNVHAFDVDDPAYPKEWRYGADGQPECAAFRDKHAPRTPYRCKRTADLFAEEVPVAEGLLPEGEGRRGGSILARPCRGHAVALRAAPARGRTGFAASIASRIHGAV